jgi:intracellular sulfur oxidation DsrE/DsrF family protein
MMIFMKHAILSALALLPLAVLSAPAQTSPKHHAVIQLTEPAGEAWDALIVHATNMRLALEKDGGVQIEVVFFGSGIDMLRKTNLIYADRLTKLAEKGVILAACQNAMLARDLKTEDLFPFATQVDAGVAEVVRKQEAGWAYLH